MMEQVLSNSDLRKRLRETAERLQLEQPRPPFRYLVDWSDDYETLFSGRYRERAGEDSLQEEALRRGRIIIHAEGGLGKSVVLGRVFLAAHAQGSVPIM